MARLTLPRVAPPSIGATMHVYAAGTENEVQLYSDSAFTVPVAQPVTLGISNIDFYTNGNVRVDIKFIDTIYNGGFTLIPDQILFDYNEAIDQGLSTTDSPTFNNLTLTNGYLGHKIQSNSIDLNDKAKINFIDFDVAEGADVINVTPKGVGTFNIIEISPSAGQVVYTDTRFIPGVYEVLIDGAQVEPSAIDTSIIGQFTLLVDPSYITSDKTILVRIYTKIITLTEAEIRLEYIASQGQTDFVNSNILANKCKVSVNGNILPTSDYIAIDGTLTIFDGLNLNDEVSIFVLTGEVASIEDLKVSGVRSELISYSANDID
jgi:hypothetical protein